MRRHVDLIYNVTSWPRLFPPVSRKSQLKQTVLNQVSQLMQISGRHPFAGAGSVSCKKEDAAKSEDGGGEWREKAGWYVSRWTSLSS